MGDRAKRTRSARHQNPALLQRRGKMPRLIRTAFKLEMHHVGALLDRPHVDARDQRQSLGQRTRIPMIFGEAIDHRGQRDDSCRRYDSRLAHPAAEHLPRPVRPGDKILAAAKNRTDRTGQALGQAKREGVRVRRDLFGRGLDATAALKIRAPSRCTGRPRRLARSYTSARCDSFTAEPPHRLWVFSRVTTEGGAK